MNLPTTGEILGDLVASYNMEMQRCNFIAARKRLRELGDMVTMLNASLDSRLLDKISKDLNE